MDMQASKVEKFSESIRRYLDNGEWRGLSEESFLEDIIFIGGKALGETDDAQGFRNTIDRLNERQLFNKGSKPIIVENI